MNIAEWIQANASLIEAKFGRNETEAYMLGNVSHTQYIVARHYGGCRFNGKYYDYNAEHDLLIREDVLQFIRTQMNWKTK